VPLLGQDFPRALSAVAIFGPGLIGGSVALALRDTPGCHEVRIWARRPDAALEAARSCGAALGTSDPLAAVSGADLVVLCTPVESMGDLARAFFAGLSGDAVVTDAGSVKRAAVAALEPVLGGRYVGAHPMAGSERAGLGAARADLFRGAPCILTPTATADPAALERADAFWVSLGCRTSRLSPSEHDRIIARMSHLPHSVAACLVATAAAAGSGLQGFAGGGYRDSTRIACGPPGMWSGILDQNADEVGAALGEMEGQLARLRGLLSRRDRAGVEEFLTGARSERAALGEREGDDGV